MEMKLPAPWQQCTVPKMFAHAVASRGARTALMYKGGGIWQQVWWREYGERARQVGLALADMGVRHGDRVAILSETRHEWLFIDMAVQWLGAVAVGLYPTSSPDQVEYVIDDCAARVVFVENEEQLDKILERLDRLPALERVVVIDMDGLHGFSHDRVGAYEKLVAFGAELAIADQQAWERLLPTAQPEDDAIIVYTSGTTGAPKGARITHANLAFQMDAWQDVAPTGPGDHTLAFLPLCHAAERLMTAIRPLAYEGVVNFAENPGTVFENMREVSPTVFLGVPRIWEKLYSNVMIALREATPLQRWAYRRAIAVGEAVADCKLARRPVSPWLALRRRIAEWTVLGNTRRMLGLDRCRLAGTGAAPISPEAIRWYLALGVDMLELYGQTECTGVATSTRTRDFEPGTVGYPVRGTELRIADDGEILVRSPGVFAGYRNKPDKTAEALRDGWLHTGDVGTLDAKGCLRITDRKSDIMITSGGKNITPSEIENKLKFSPYVTDAVVIADRRPYVTCLIMIDQDNVGKFALEKRLPFTDYGSLTRLPDVRKLIAAEVERANASLNNVESVKKFELLDVLLTAEDEEMTPTLKLRRRFVYQKYGGLIEGMYRGS